LRYFKIISKQGKYTIIAYNKGYRVINGDVISPFSGKKIKLNYQKKQKYYRFIIESNKKRYRIYVHKLLAYQKYGLGAFIDGIHIRHLNNNSLINLDDNITLGSPTENSLDIKPEDRLKHSIKASTKTRKFTDNKIEEIRVFYKDNHSYIETMENFDISSKGTLHYILNNKYITKLVA